MVVLLRLTLHDTFTSFAAGTMVVLDIVVTSISSFSYDVLMRLASVEILLQLVFTKLLVRELIRALVLSLLLASTFIALKPRISCCNASLITKKGICKRFDSSFP